MITTDTQNGRHKGRAVPAVPTHTFRDSGITVKLHKLSPMTSQEIMAAVQRERSDTKPQPPIFEIDYGKGTIQEPNYAHPLYVERLDRWQSECNAEANRRLFRLACLAAVEVEITPEVHAEIKRKKRLLRLAAKLEWEDDPELEPDENDQIFYVTHICCASPEDVTEFYAAIALRSQPTEAAIEQHKASFRGDVQGPVDLEQPSAERDQA
jgi:hypothetical protein